MMSTNTFQPKIYQVTKIMEDKPKGLIVLTFKQDEYNDKKDNIELFCCDYYDDSGKVIVDNPTVTPEPTEEDKCVLYQCTMDSNGNLTDNEEIEPLHVGKTTYFRVEYGSKEANSSWKIECLDDTLSDDEKEYYCSRITIATYNNFNISISVAQIRKLIGMKFRLTVTNDMNTNETAFLDMEVQK